MGITEKLQIGTALKVFCFSIMNDLLKLIDGHKKTTYIFSRRSRVRCSIFSNPLKRYRRAAGVSFWRVRWDSRIAAQGVQPLVRSEVTQNSPDIQVSGLLPRRAHIHGRQTMYRSAPLVQRDLLPEAKFEPRGESCFQQMKGYDFFILVWEEYQQRFSPGKWINSKNSVKLPAISPAPSESARKSSKNSLKI